MGDFSSSRIASISGREGDAEREAPDGKPRKPRLKAEEEKPKPEGLEEDFGTETENAEPHDLDEMA